MSKVDIVGRSGRVISVHPRVAQALEQRGGYMRRDMVAQPAIVPPPAKKAGTNPHQRRKKAAKKAAAKSAQPNKEASE
ncbi:hypothetical protein [Stenotrophomonas rhizophila]|uniref:hypothetical protein n=1 Tax=Stenotrophomonas rhizophila TaxID=216778 RepID=UPI0028B215F3|nr:hypothetical protein [Stenotrophomonas rhizophila]